MTGHYFTAPWANVFWALLGGGTTATQAGLDGWTSAFGEAYYTNLAPALQENCHIELATATLFQPGETALHSVHSMAHIGVGTSPPVSDMAACRVISWTSNVYWRGGKPRTYLPGLVTADTTDGKVLTSSAIAGLKNAGQAFHTAINALSSTGITQTQHGFVSFSSGGVERDPGVFFPINGATAHQRIGTQRRRLGAWLP